MEDNGESVWRVLSLEVPDEVLTDNICNRWVHEPSKREYHPKFKPPKSLRAGHAPRAGQKGNMLDDETQQPLIQREEDSFKAVHTRLNTYNAQTKAVLDHYEAKHRKALLPKRRFFLP